MLRAGSVFVYILSFLLINPRKGTETRICGYIPTEHYRFLLINPRKGTETNVLAIARSHLGKFPINKSPQGD